MKQVTKAEFFDKIGKLDVHPRVDETSLKGRYSSSLWETPRRVVIGKSISDLWASEPTQFFLV